MNEEKFLYNQIWEQVHNPIPVNQWITITLQRLEASPKIDIEVFIPRRSNAMPRLRKPTSKDGYYELYRFNKKLNLIYEGIHEFYPEEEESV